MLFQAVPLYVAEISPEELRGRLLCFLTTYSVTGMFVSILTSPLLPVAEKWCNFLDRNCDKRWCEGPPIWLAYFNGGANPAGDTPGTGHVLSTKISKVTRG